MTRILVFNLKNERVSIFEYIITEILIYCSYFVENLLSGHIETEFVKNATLFWIQKKKVNKRCLFELFIFAKKEWILKC